MPAVMELAMIVAAAVLALMCEACEERAGNPFGFPFAHKPGQSWDAGPVPASAGAPQSPEQAAAKPPPSDLQRVSPKMTKRVEPVYPAQALREEIEGRVVARFQIAPDGVPFNVTIQTSSNPVFDGPVLRALTMSRFEPQPPNNPIYGGRWFQQPYAFRFEADTAPPAPTPSS